MEPLPGACLPGYLISDPPLRSWSAKAAPNSDGPVVLRRRRGSGNAVPVVQNEAERDLLKSRRRCTFRGASVGLAEPSSSSYPFEMSDIPAPSKFAEAGWVHFCEHPGCTEWGPYGHGPSNGTIHWYCREHDQAGGRGSEGRGRTAMARVR